MVLGGEGNKHPHRPLTGTRMCTSGRKTQKYQRWCLVAPEGGTSPAVWIFLVSHFIVILMTLEWLLKYEGQSCIQNLLHILRMAIWPFLDFSPWAAGLNLSRRAVSSLALPRPGALRTWCRGEMECFGFPFWILETGIAAAEQELILWAVLGRLHGLQGGWPCTAGTTRSPGAGGFRQVWEASATNPAQLLPSCLTAWRHLNA